MASVAAAVSASPTSRCSATAANSACTSSGIAWLLLGRSHAIPEDVQALFAAVAEHRLVGEADTSTATLAKQILHAVPVA